MIKIVTVYAALITASVTYGQSSNEASEKPVVIMVSTEWCAPCREMKKNVMPKIYQKFDGDVTFITVNPDKNQDIAKYITDGGPIPQLVIFHKTQQGWLRKKLVGGHRYDDVEAFITSKDLTNARSFQSKDFDSIREKLENIKK